MLFFSSFPRGVRLYLGEDKLFETAGRKFGRQPAIHKVYNEAVPLAMDVARGCITNGI
jgi:hypothetical protein